MGNKQDVDLLSVLDDSASLSEKHHSLHIYLKKRFPFLDHISVAVYDPKTDILSTLLDSSGETVVMSNYQDKLGDSISLSKIFHSGKPRVINDLYALSGITKEHAQRIRDAGYRSSYTMPIYFKGTFFGFIFFNSCQANCFQPDIVNHLNPIGRLLGLTVVCEIKSIDTMVAATKTFRHITSRRDCETGAHLERMSRYSRLISQHISEIYHLSDETIEDIFLFAPLHDIGKIAIPDNILLKPGPLDDEEYALMKTHSARGLEIINTMLKEFELTNHPNIDILRNIIYHHHENFDGSGYPGGLVGEAIPIEARVVAIADVFDALTSKRPYKDAWSNDQAFTELERLQGKHLDPHCVAAMQTHRPEIEVLQLQFRENEFG